MKKLATKNTIELFKNTQRAARFYGKQGKKIQRRARLCKNNRFVFERYVSKDEMKEISIWCDENLNGIHHWFFEPSWPTDRGAEIGFHNKWDLVAFKIRWSG